LLDKDSKIDPDDIKTYNQNLLLISKFVIESFPEKISICGTVKSSTENQVVEIRHAIKKGAKQLGKNYKLTGVIQIPALLAVLCACVSTGKKTEIESTIEKLVN
jgi:hypothetical protein